MFGARLLAPLPLVARYAARSMAAAAAPGIGGGGDAAATKKALRARVDAALKARPAEVVERESAALCASMMPAASDTPPVYTPMCM